MSRITQKDKLAKLDAMLTHILNRRVTVENYLLECYAGKRPLPDKDQCKKLALFLGDPTFREKL